jgi:hypothetical protein
MRRHPSAIRDGRRRCDRRRCSHGVTADQRPTSVRGLPGQLCTRQRSMARGLWLSFQRRPRTPSRPALARRWRQGPVPAPRRRDQPVAEPGRGTRRVQSEESDHPDGGLRAGWDDRQNSHRISGGVVALALDPLGDSAVPVDARHLHTLSMRSTASSSLQGRSERTSAPGATAPRTPRAMTRWPRPQGNPQRNPVESRIRRAPRSQREPSPSAQRRHHSSET